MRRDGSRRAQSSRHRRRRKRRSLSSTVRATFTLNGLKEVTGGTQLLVGFEVRVDGQDKPAAVGEVVYNYYT